MDCVFCKICAKELPGKMIYQDTILSCFLPRKTAEKPEFLHFCPKSGHIFHNRPVKMSKIQSES